MARGHARWAFFNRSGNQIIRLVLRSPLHPLLSRQLALITVTGRRSGRQFTFPVGYQGKGNQVRINVGWPDQKLWWRNLRGDGAPVRLRVHGVERAGHAVASGDEQSGVVVDVHLDPSNGLDSDTGKGL